MASATWAFSMLKFVGEKRPLATANSPVTITGIHSIDEKDSFCDSERRTRLRVLMLRGVHHYAGNYVGVGNLIGNNMPRTQRACRSRVNEAGTELGEDRFDPLRGCEALRRFADP